MLYSHPSPARVRYRILLYTFAWFYSCENKYSLCTGSLHFPNVWFVYETVQSLKRKKKKKLWYEMVTTQNKNLNNHRERLEIYRSKYEGLLNLIVDQMWASCFISDRLQIALYLVYSICWRCTNIADQKINARKIKVFFFFFICSRAWYLVFLCLQQEIGVNLTSGQLRDIADCRHKHALLQGFFFFITLLFQFTYLKMAVQINEIFF